MSIDWCVRPTGRQVVRRATVGDVLAGLHAVSRPLQRGSDWHRDERRSTGHSTHLSDDCQRRDAQLLEPRCWPATKFRWHCATPSGEASLTRVIVGKKICHCSASILVVCRCWLFTSAIGGNQTEFIRTHWQ